MRGGSRHARLVLAVVVAVAAVAGVVLVDRGHLGTRAGDPGALEVVGLGDSVMAGTACGCSGIAAEYAAGWGRRLHRTVHGVNLGVSGDTTTTLLRRLDTDPATRTSLGHADVVLVVEGANDLVPQLHSWQEESCPAACYRPAVAAMGRRLERALAAVRRTAPAGAQVLVAGYWNVFTDGEVARADGGERQVRWSRALTRDANRVIAASARAEDATYVDLTPALAADDGDPTDHLADDGDHPNAAGVSRIVAALLAATHAPA